MFIIKNMKRRSKESKDRGSKEQDFSQVLQQGWTCWLFKGAKLKISADVQI